MATRLTQLRMGSETKARSDERPIEVGTEMGQGQLRENTASTAEPPSSDERGIDAEPHNAVTTDREGERREVPAEDQGLPVTASTTRSKGPHPRYVKRTYYMRPEQVDAIESVAFFQKMDISEVVRRAVDAYLAEHGGDTSRQVRLQPPV